MEIKLSESTKQRIVTAAELGDYLTIGKAAELLRFGYKLNYDQSMEVFKEMGLDPEHIEGLLYQADINEGAEG